MSKTIGFRVNDNESEIIKAAMTAHQQDDLKSLVFFLLENQTRKPAVNDTDLILSFNTDKEKSTIEALLRLNKISATDLLIKLLQSASKQIIKPIKGI